MKKSNADQLQHRAIRQDPVVERRGSLCINQDLANFSLCSLLCCGRLLQHLVELGAAFCDLRTQIHVKAGLCAANTKLATTCLNAHYCPGKGQRRVCRHEELTHLVFRAQAPSFGVQALEVKSASPRNHVARHDLERLVDHSLSVEVKPALLKHQINAPSPSPVCSQRGSCIMHVCKGSDNGNTVCWNLGRARHGQRETPFNDMAFRQGIQPTPVQVRNLNSLLGLERAITFNGPQAETCLNLED
mmetsp:Transcript_15850/g.35984  ORF Transcript_15850/g.35984 Transcript_15850/m.35984 type:complete len:245 (+) Transcript_15850:1247-1981(+)